MTPVKRIQDMLPALIVFAVVAVFGTYATVAYVARDPWWLNTLVELRHQQDQARKPGASPASQSRAAHRAAERRGERAGPRGQ